MIRPVLRSKSLISVMSALRDDLDGELLVVGLEDELVGVKASSLASMVSGMRVRSPGSGVLLAVDDDVLAEVLLEEFVGADEVVLVVLLEDGGGVGRGEGLEGDGGRVDGGGDVGELDLVVARGEGELADLADDAEAGDGLVGVVAGVPWKSWGSKVAGSAVEYTVREKRPAVVSLAAAAGSSLGVLMRGWAWARARRGKRMRDEGRRMNRITAGSPFLVPRPRPINRGRGGRGLGIISAKPRMYMRGLAIFRRKCPAERDLRKVVCLGGG